ncbi:hypothetical protein OC845_006500 [Tilletia horrida]|nr:hypothetical protein OC845_006500 [Tilletia horrida]
MSDLQIETEEEADWINGRIRRSTPSLASTVHPQVRDILSDETLAGSRMGEAMIRAHKLQLDLHSQQERAYHDLLNRRGESIDLPVLKDREAPGTDQHKGADLFSQAAFRIAAELSRAGVQDQTTLLQKAPIWSSPSLWTAILRYAQLPYAMLHRALSHSARVAAAQVAEQTTADDPQTTGYSLPKEVEGDKIDEWIIRNEKYMRARLILDAPSAESGLVRQADEDIDLLGIDNDSSHWQHYMVGLGRDGPQIFGSSGNPEGAIAIDRPIKAELPGLLILDELRQSRIKINTLASFIRRFDAMTAGILKGLDWTNVIVAGGLPLAVLTSVTNEQAEQYQGSDIDLYLHGLNAKQATAKLQEIEKIYSANLPIDDKTGENIEFAVIRNSQTVTFVPERYSSRRVQVILKLCANPMAVLLNFDLDQVGLAYDGTEVYMLPRTARAIITSYTVFTMDLIHGSFLSSRKATQDQRVFKYASRGFGLRFLPSYIEALPQVPTTERTSMDPDVDESTLSRDILHVTLREERARVGWWLARKTNDGYIWGRNAEEVIPLKELDSRYALSPELAERSSLSGWQHFMRYVALWEFGQMGYCKVGLSESDFGAHEYEDDPLGYQDGPHVAWHANSSLEEVRTAVEGYVQREEDTFKENMGAFGIQVPDSAAESGNTALYSDAFSHSLVTFVHLPRNFREYAMGVLADSPSSLSDVTLPGAPSHRPDLRWYNAEQMASSRTDADFACSYWILHGSNKDGELTPNWQLVNREVDEIHETLHAFRHGHRHLRADPSIRNKQTARCVSRRLVRPTERMERKAFTAWVCTRAHKNLGWYEERTDWSTLDAPRWMVFRRFELTTDEAEADDSEYYTLQDYDDSDDRLKQPPQTAATADRASPGVAVSRSSGSVSNFGRII